MPVSVRDLMSPLPAVVGPETSLSEAAELIWKHRLSDLYVTGSSGCLLGVLPDYSVLKLSLTDPELPGCVASLMSCQVASVASCQSAVEVALRFRDAVVRSIPVLEGNRLVGMVTRAELLPHLIASSANSSSGRGSAPARRSRPPHFSEHRLKAWL
ncbi:MAG: CBS domain-containing protein [Planctomycetaceae bacterium]|nr:CBS domain-containing protein [Planctomycetaceae bacterium]